MRPAHRREGSGRPLVCHPGGPGFSALSLGDLAGLGARVELVPVDPRGTGRSPRPDDPRAYAIGDDVADVEELGELVARELPCSFAHFREQERAYHDMIRGEVPNADALRLFNEETLETFELGRIEAPTLVITGERDFSTGPGCAAELAAAIPRATFREEVARWLA